MGWMFVMLPKLSLLHIADDVLNHHAGLTFFLQLPIIDGRRCTASVAWSPTFAQGRGLGASLRKSAGSDSSTILQLGVSPEAEGLSPAHCIHSIARKAIATAFPLGPLGPTPPMSGLKGASSITSQTTEGSNPLTKKKEEPVCTPRDERCLNQETYKSKTPLGQCCREQATKALQHGMNPMSPPMLGGPSLLQVSVDTWRSAPKATSFAGGGLPSLPTGGIGGGGSGSGSSKSSSLDKLGEKKCFATPLQCQSPQVYLAKDCVGEYCRDMATKSLKANPPKPPSAPPGMLQVSVQEWPRQGMGSFL